MPAEEIRLLPCPFCGNDVHIEERSFMADSPSTSSFGGFLYSHTETQYSILCGQKRCWLSTARSYSDKQRLIEDWNRRADTKKCSRRTATNSRVTQCPTCGGDCTVGGDDDEGTHYYIPCRGAQS